MCKPTDTQSSKQHKMQNGTAIRTVNRRQKRTQQIKQRTRSAQASCPADTAARQSTAPQREPPRGERANELQKVVQLVGGNLLARFEVAGLALAGLRERLARTNHLLYTRTAGRADESSAGNAAKCSGGLPNRQSQAEVHRAAQQQRQSGAGLRAGTQVRQQHSGCSAEKARRQTTSKADLEGVQLGQTRLVLVVRLCEATKEQERQ